MSKICPVLGRLFWTDKNIAGGSYKGGGGLNIGVYNEAMESQGQTWPLHILKYDYKLI